MCGRYVSPDSASIERQWQVLRSPGEPFPERFNVAPGADVPFLYFQKSQLKFGSAKWGLVPHWWKDAKAPRLSHNARIEEAAGKPMWRDAMRGARGLMPARGWYEWRADKQPYYFYRRDGRLLALAGLYSFYENRITCAVLTTAAQGRLEAVHDRMPVFLDDAAQAAWLEKGLVEMDVEKIELHPVRRTVNTAALDGPQLIEPLAA